MASALVLLLRAVARRDARKLPQILNHNNASVLAHGWNANLPDEAARRVYSNLAREVEGFDRSWRFWDLGLRRGFSSKSSVEEKVVEETVVKVKKVGRPRKVEDGVEKAKPRRKPRASMKKLEEEIAANEAASGSAHVKLKLTRKKRSESKVEALVGADSVVSSGDDFVGVATSLGVARRKLDSNVDVRGQDCSALADGVIDSLNLEAVGESSNAILSSLVEDGESQGEREEVRKVSSPLKEATDSPPRIAPRFPKIDLTSKQRITSVELDGDDKGHENGANVVVPAQYSDPKMVLHQLQQARPGPYTSAEKARLSWIFHRFAESGLVRQALAGL